MKARNILLFTVLLSLLTLNATGQPAGNKHSVTGSWLGKINTGAVELRIVFNLSIIPKDSLVATLDSPDQGAKGIKLGPVSLINDSIKISAGGLLAEYKGFFRSDTLIEGTWKQAGRSMPLGLHKLKGAFTLNRPQEPHPPFPYKEEEVSIENKKAGIKLSGTLTIPAGTGPFPAVILISGSGAQNRNEELLGHKPFMVIADYLSRNGIAVLRYDDRGVARSQGNFLAATSADFATDAHAAYLFLATRDDIDHKLTGFAGHSEGGLIAPMVASEEPSAGFIISLAGPGVNGEQIINKQSADISRASGAKGKDIKASASTNSKLFAILKKEKDNKLASEKMTALYKKILEGQKLTDAQKSDALKNIQASMAPAGLTWLRYFLVTNPSVYWEKVTCPVLALNGSKDLQVASAINLAAIEKALKKGRNERITVMELPGLNHLFQHASTGLPTEYGNIEETISPELLKIMADWIISLKNGKAF